MTNISLLLLAAGSSTRMGQSKQLLKIGDESLLAHSAAIAIASRLRTIVVLGANEAEHRKAIASLQVDLVSNTNWKNGMGGSIKAGLKHLLKSTPLTEAVIVMVCDQPLLRTIHLEKLKTRYESSGKRIIASLYSGTPGVPALFHNSLFSEIMDLPDDVGAKKIFQRHTKDMLTIDFPEGVMDLDTPDDYKNFSA